MRIREKYVNIVYEDINSIAERWYKRYGGKEESDWINVISGSSKDIYEKLIALGPNPPIDSIEEIIGNKSWTHISCDGCGEYTLQAVAIGECGAKNYCETCIREAFTILTTVGEE